MDGALAITGCQSTLNGRLTVQHTSGNVLTGAEPGSVRSRSAAAGL
jgi:hypothetical protein